MKLHFLMAVAAACAMLWATSGAASDVGIHHNPDQHFDWQCGNCKKTTTVDKGGTNLVMTCYGQKNTKDPMAGGWSVNCSSPEAGIECQWQGDNSLCYCHSDTPKAHTVKMHMDNSCTKPN